VARATAAEIVEHFVTAARQGPAPAPPLGWEGAEVIALDDLHTLAGRPVTQREVARILRAAVAAGSRMLCAASDPVSPLEPLVEALRKAAAFALIAVTPPNDREVRRVLLERAPREAVQPTRRALATLAASAGGDVRRAIGALTRYRFQAELAGPRSPATPKARA
jgi:chromosomal replication initiation ATPase DnaA